MDKKRLTDEEIIAALIAEGSIKAAAALLGCAVRTLYTRMKSPDFKDLYARAKADLIKSATAKLQGNFCAAIDTLAEIMTDEETAKQTRVNSAATILSYGVKFTETVDILERLEALEQSQEMTKAI